MNDFPDYKAAAEELACHEEEISAEAMGLKIGSATPTMGAARLIIEAALGDETLYRKADDCVFGTRHWIGEHGKPCLECGAEQIWVLPVEVKE